MGRETGIGGLMRKESDGRERGSWKMGGSSLNFSVLGRVRLLVKNYSVSIFYC